MYIFIALFLVEQCGILAVSAATTKTQLTQKSDFIYVRHSTVIDDSWIGTPVKPIKKVTIKKTTTVAKKKTTYTPTPAGTLQKSDGSWILPSIKTPTKKTSSWIVTPAKIPKTQNTKLTPTAKKAQKALKAKTNITLNSAPAEQPSLSNNISSYVPTEYTTPNGTPLTYLSQGSYTVPPSNKIELTSLSASGGITYNNTTGVFSDALTFSN